MARGPRAGSAGAACPPEGVGIESDSLAAATGPITIDFDPIARDDEDDPRGDVRSIAANGLTIDEGRLSRSPADDPAGAVGR